MIIARDAARMECEALQSRLGAAGARFSEDLNRVQFANDEILESAHSDIEDLTERFQELQSEHYLLVEEMNKREQELKRLSAERDEARAEAESRPNETRMWRPTWTPRKTGSCRWSRSNAGGLRISRRRGIVP